MTQGIGYLILLGIPAVSAWLLFTDNTQILVGACLVICVLPFAAFALKCLHDFAHSL